MSDSPLAAYTCLSPNRTSPRNHKIDTVTIHCMAGELSVEACGALFARTSVGASANYGIGPDGRVALYVSETDRSWCSSNAENDHRAVTIEVASKASHPYAVTGAAYESLIALCADICRRNGIRRLLWQGDKNLAGQVDRQNMTAHRWFAAKACPGDYLYSRFGDIAAQVNKRLEETPVSVEEAKNILKERLDLSDVTIQYLWSYRYGDELLTKLAEAVERGGG